MRFLKNDYSSKTELSNVHSVITACLVPVEITFAHQCTLHTSVTKLQFPAYLAAEEAIFIGVL